MQNRSRLVAAFVTRSKELDCTAHEEAEAIAYLVTLLALGSESVEDARKILRAIRLDCGEIVETAFAQRESRAKEAVNEILEALKLEVER